MSSINVSIVDEPINVTLYGSAPSYGLLTPVEINTSRIIDNNHTVMASKRIFSSSGEVTITIKDESYLAGTRFMICRYGTGHITLQFANLSEAIKMIYAPGTCSGLIEIGSDPGCIIDLVKLKANVWFADIEGNFDIA